MQNDRQITISVGSSRKATFWQAQTLLLSELYEKLRIPARGTETMAEYLSLPKTKQDELKDVGGYVAGTLIGTRRKAGAVAGRDVLTLDLDQYPCRTDAGCGGSRGVSGLRLLHLLDTQASSCRAAAARTAAAEPDLHGG